MSRRSTVLLLVLVAGFAFRLAFIAHDMRDLVVRGPLYDDSFYSFGIARHMAAGDGSTFDGLRPTNGYQPLYVLLLVPLYWISGNHPTVPIYAALVLSALVNVWTGLILYRLVRRHAAWEAAVFGLVLWSFGPAIVRQSVNGLETALAMFLLAAALEYYLTVFRPRPHPGLRQVLTLGVLLGLAIFARIDAAFFAVALGVDALWRGGRAALRPLAGAAATAAVVLLPWCVSSLLLVGTVLPESGSATRLLSEAYAPRDVPALAGSAAESGVPPQLLEYNVGRSMLLLGTAPAVHVFTRGLELLLGRAHVDANVTLFVIGSLVVLILLASVFVLHRRRLVRGDRVPSDYNFLYLYSLLLVAAYSFVVFGHIFFSRYYYPIFFFSILLSAFAFEVLVGLVGRPGTARRRAVAAVVIGCYALALPYMAWHRLQNGNYQFLNVVDWITHNTEPDARIGIFNCGAIGYFSDRRIVDLDGKVNSEALRALRAGNVPAYVESQHLDYVIDHEWILRRFLHLDRPPADGLAYEQMAGDAALGVRGWEAYRVHHAAAPASSGPAAAPPTLATRFRP